MLDTTKTKQADSQLHFAPKIIKLYLVVFENELIEDAMLVLKSLKTENPCFRNVSGMIGELNKLLTLIHD